MRKSNKYQDMIDLLYEMLDKTKNRYHMDRMSLICWLIRQYDELYITDLTNDAIINDTTIFKLLYDRNELEKFINFVSIILKVDFSKLYTEDASTIDDEVVEFTNSTTEYLFKNIQTLQESLD